VSEHHSTFSHSGECHLHNAILLSVNLPNVMAPVALFTLTGSLQLVGNFIFYSCVESKQA